jgi:hypothetical protein
MNKDLSAMNPTVTALFEQYARDPGRLWATRAGEPRVQRVEVEKDYWRRVKRQRLADDEAADNRITELLADLGLRCPLRI